MRRLRDIVLGPTSDGVLHGIAVLVLGSGAARAIGLLSIPLITRLYSPQDMGVLAVFMALVVVLAPLVSLRYVQTLPLPRSDGAAFNTFVLSAGLIALNSALVGALLWAFGPAFLNMLGMQALLPWRPLVLLGVVTVAGYELLTHWATRKGRYGLMAKTSVWQGAAGAGAKIALGLAGWKPAGLLLGQVVGQGGGIGSMLRGFAPEFRALRPHVSRRRMAAMAHRYRGFPIYRVPSQGLLMLSMQAPILFFAAVYSPELTGQLSLAITALALPINVVGTSAGQALYSEAAKALHHSPDKIPVMARQVMGRLFLIGLVPAVVLMLGGAWLFGLVFGEVWRMAGSFAALLSVSLLFQFAAAPAMQLLNLAPNQMVFLAINLARMGLILVVGAVGLWTDASPQQVIAAYAAAMTLFYILVAYLSLILVTSKRQARP